MTNYNINVLMGGILLVSISVKATNECAAINRARDDVVQVLASIGKLRANTCSKLIFSIVN